MKVKFLIIVLILNIGITLADTTQSPAAQTTPSLTTPQRISFENCTKMFEGLNKEKLFYLTLGAINANKFSVDEIQTNNGYIIFSAAGNKYLATIAGIDNNNSILKITPCNEIYYFQPGIIVNMFKYIEINKSTDVK